MFIQYIKRSSGTDRAGRPLDVTPELRGRLARVDVTPALRGHYAR